MTERERFKRDRERDVRDRDNRGTKMDRERREREERERRERERESAYLLPIPSLGPDTAKAFNSSLRALRMFSPGQRASR